MLGFQPFCTSSLHCSTPLTLMVETRGGTTDLSPNETTFLLDHPTEVRHAVPLIESGSEGLECDDARLDSCGGGMNKFLPFSCEEK